MSAVLALNSRTSW